MMVESCWQGEMVVQLRAKFWSTVAVLESVGAITTTVRTKEALALARVSSSSENNAVGVDVGDKGD